MKRELVIPGKEVAQGNIKLGKGVYREGDKIYSSILGLLDKKNQMVRVIPIAGKYFPNVGDYVVGKVIGAPLPAAWELEIYSAYKAILNASDYYREIDPFRVPLNKVMEPGTMLYALIREISPQRKVYITMRTRGTAVLRGGRVVTLLPAKIPRVIGKKRSMLNMIRKMTMCRVLVGQNGMVWVKGEKEMEDLVEKVLKEIEEKAHTPGLTDRIREMIERERK